MSANDKEYNILVAIDFSPCSANALKNSQSIMGRMPNRTYVLHVIDQDFIAQSVASRLGTEAEIKKSLFIQAKQKLKQFLQAQKLVSNSIEMEVCAGTPFLEINRKAIEKDVDIVVMGTHGTSGDLKRIFFGSTTERVLRFLKRPVLCFPIEEERKD